MSESYMSVHEGAARAGSSFTKVDQAERAAEHGRGGTDVPAPWWCREPSWVYKLCLALSVHRQNLRSPEGEL
jgi:hypothetical protein